jgi:hypothetical protein
LNLAHTVLTVAGALHCSRGSCRIASPVHRGNHTRHSDLISAVPA